MRTTDTAQCPGFTGRGTEPENKEQQLVRIILWGCTEKLPELTPPDSLPTQCPVPYDTATPARAALPGKAQEKAFAGQRGPGQQRRQQAGLGGQRSTYPRGHPARPPGPLPGAGSAPSLASAATQSGAGSSAGRSPDGQQGQQRLRALAEWPVEEYPTGELVSALRGPEPASCSSFLPSRARQAEPLSGCPVPVVPRAGRPPDSAQEWVLAPCRRCPVYTGQTRTAEPGGAAQLHPGAWPTASCFPGARGLPAEAPASCDCPSAQPAISDPLRCPHVASFQSH